MAGYSASSSLRIRDPTQAPELQCGCGLLAFRRTARTPRNPQLVLLHCDVRYPAFPYSFVHFLILAVYGFWRFQFTTFFFQARGLWIWEDVLNVYAGEVVEYLQLEGRKSKDVPKLNCGCGRPFASLGTQTPNQSRWLHCKVHGQSTQEQELRLVYTLYCIKNFDGGDKIHTTDVSPLSCQLC